MLIHRLVRIIFPVSFVLIFSVFHFDCFSQTALNDQLEQLYTRVAADSTHGFQLSKNENSILFTKVELTECKNLFGGLRGTSTIDTLWVKITYDLNWDDHRIDTTKKYNTEILDSVETRFLQKADSIQWRMKTNRNYYNSNRSEVILDFQHFLGLENNYKNLLKQLIPIPHFTRDNTGYFITYFPGYGARILNDHQRNQFFHVD
jgi:hypothetical protein